MEEIDEKRKFQKRYEGWSSHRSWIFCGILYLWHDGCCRRPEYLAGGISGSLLPDFMLSALSVAIYGMFLAIIIPPSKKSRPVLGVVAASMAVSTVFAVTPVLKQVSSGFMIIITTLLVAGLAAYFCPLEEKGEAVHES